MIPKFRAWDETECVMRSWKELDVTKDTGEDFFMIGHQENIAVTAYWHKQTLLQYTGIKDKTGVEIYEGDIIKIPDDWDVWGMNSGEIYEVYFGFGGFRMRPKYNNNSRGYYVEYENEFEVIGNIYENPELLEVSE